MLSTELYLANHRLKIKALQPLSGGITGRNIQIVDNGMGQLEIKGDFKITIKVLNLCSKPTPKLNILMSRTKNLLSSFFKGPLFVYNYNYFKYNP